MTEEELPGWMRTCNHSLCGACCCCVCRYYLKAFKPYDEDSSDDEGEGIRLNQVKVEDASAATVVKVRPYRPVSLPPWRPPSNIDSFFAFAW